MKLRIFTTGGTIDKIYFDAASEFQIGESQIGKLLSHMNVNFEFEITSIFRKDSLDITEEDRASIRKVVEAEQNDRILITHGTDTMVETAKALKGIAGKTIVLTGAMQPASMQLSDAPFNIGAAVIAVQALAEGVYIVINGTIFCPDGLKKDRELKKFLME